MTPLQISEHLAAELATHCFAPPVTHVYNPLVYAAAAHARYLELYATSPKEIVLVGMNPGPFGMAQTGVPFGEVRAVRDWMGIEAPVGKPQHEHPKRPIDGFACTKSEVSGARLWGWAQQNFGSAQAFFKRFFVANYCPLVFMEDSGKNRTPDKLPRAEKHALFALCDTALRELVLSLQPRAVIGVGAFAQERVREAVAGLPVTVGHLLHPSPASPLANRGWGEQASRQLQQYGV